MKWHPVRLASKHKSGRRLATLRPAQRRSVAARIGCHHAHSEVRVICARARVFASCPCIALCLCEHQLLHTSAVALKPPLAPQDKNADKREAAEKKFKEISEAYEVCLTAPGLPPPRACDAQQPPHHLRPVCRYCLIRRSGKCTTSSAKMASRAAFLRPAPAACPARAAVLAASTFNSVPQTPTRSSNRCARPSAPPLAPRRNAAQSPVRTLPAVLAGVLALRAQYARLTPNSGRSAVLLRRFRRIRRL